MINYLKIDVKTSSAEEADILIATLSEIHFYAFEQNENILSAYIYEDHFSENDFNKILGDGEVVSKKILEDRNWNAQWESDFRPVRIGDFAIIRAAFHEPPTGVKFDLLITPKMSFGTGHHATTWLMIAQMEHILFQDKTVLDFGTGTGVLAILAEKLGASKILAIDLDEWSINNTVENIRHNNCKRIEVEQRDNLVGLNKADIILANINLNILEVSSKSISLIQKAGSLLLTSGFLLQDAEAIEKIFKGINYKVISRMERENWVSILFRQL